MTARLQAAKGALMLQSLFTKKNTALLLAYGFFILWYSHFGGPLSPEAQTHYLNRLVALGYNAEQLERLQDFMAHDDGNDFIMVNLINLNPSPQTLPATGEGAPPEALIDHYMAHMTWAQLARASHPVFFGSVTGPSIDLLGIENAEVWSLSALFRYRSRQDVMEIISDPRFRERHEYKLAAMLQTIAVPVTPRLQLSDPRFLLAIVFLIFIDRGGPRRSA